MDNLAFLSALDALTKTAAQLREQYLTEFCEHRHYDPTGAVNVVLPIIARACGEDAEEILNGGRRQALVVPRQLAMWTFTQLTMLSLPQIAKAFRRKDHTTAMHARDKIDAMRKADARFLAKTDAMLKLCGMALDSARVEVA